MTKGIIHVVVCDMCGTTTPFDDRVPWFQISRVAGEPERDPFGVPGKVPVDRWAICSPECLSAFVNLMYEKDRA